MTRPFAQLDTSIEIVTPENISFQYEVAGPFRRIPAFMIDVMIRFLILFLLQLAIFFSGFATGTIVSFVIGYFFLEWFYGAVLETYWNGQTLGKRAMGIRVLSVNGQPINGLQAMMRNLLRMADMMPVIPMTAFGEQSQMMVFSCFIGLFFSMLSKRYQRLGDLVSGTIVVVEEKKRLLAGDYAKEKSIVTCAAMLPANLQLSKKVAKALATYAERRKFLSPSRRIEIASYLVEPLIRRFELPQDTDYDLLMRALYYRTFIEQSRDSDERDESYVARLESLAPFRNAISKDGQSDGESAAASFKLP